MYIKHAYVCMSNYNICTEALKVSKDGFTITMNMSH